MTYSLNELAGLLRKAVTGAGFPMGHAVAISTAGVWLARRGVPVCDLVARSIDVGMRDSLVERESGGVRFRSARASVDGVAAIELLLAGTPDDVVELQDVDEPVLLVGFAGVAAETHGVVFEICHVNGAMSVTPDVDAPALGPVLEHGTIKPGTVTLALSGSLTSGPSTSVVATRYDPAVVGDTGWEKLAALAQRTYVPASEQSRISGAGAGLTDND